MIPVGSSILRFLPCSAFGAGRSIRITGTRLVEVVAMTSLPAAATQTARTSSSRRPQSMSARRKLLLTTTNLFFI